MKQDVESRFPVLLEFDADANHYGFQIPIRFRIGDVNLLVSSKSDGTTETSLPLFVAPFATLGMACLRVAQTTGRAALDLDDYGVELLFKVRHDSVLICSTLVETTVRIDYATLFSAWLIFAGRVKEVVIKRHPEKEAYEWWKLIDRHPDDRLIEELTRERWFQGYEDFQ